MRFADLRQEVIIWTCYLENWPDPEHYLNLYGLSNEHRLAFDNLGRFFPFDTFYSRRPDDLGLPALKELGQSNKSFVLPWIYRPPKAISAISGKKLIVPSENLFIRLDNKINAKNLFQSLSIPTPKWSYIFTGGSMIEKPIRNSAGGLGIKQADANAAKGCFLEEYIDGCRSIGLQFFIFDEPEFICADEMLYEDNTHDKFSFHAQANIHIDELPVRLMDDCFRLLDHLADAGYKGFIGIDALIGEGTYYLLEINPRGIAFTPAYFAASALGWTSFKTFMKKTNVEMDEILLLDFGHSKKFVKKT